MTNDQTAGVQTISDVDAQETIALDAAHVVQTYKRAPLVLDRGEGMTVYDTEGHAYLDFVAGIAVQALGHSDPGVVAAIQEQAGKLIQVSNLFYSAPMARLAEQLCELSFADRVFFCNSGGEANEAAIKFARKYARASSGRTDKTQFVCFDHAFHGRTMGTLALTPKEAYQAPFRPLMPDVVVAPFNDVAGLDTAITDRTCAVFVEPLQGEGGIYPATPEFMQAIRAKCDAVGALLVCDEIQCGLGRTGALWAYTALGVTPDIMTLAKPLAAGLPIGAALCTEKVASVLVPGDHGSTFAGGALVCHVAEYVLDRIAQPEFLAHVEAMGEYLRDRLSEINSPHIKAIRGRGLLIGVELDIEASKVIEQGPAHGLLLVGAGSNVLRLVPPLIVEAKHIDTLAEKLTAILAGL
ncbi:MAG: aspartate aminotransferase family protein [Aggregatilineales bacterium]